MKVHSAFISLTVVALTLACGQAARSQNLIYDGEFNNGIGQLVNQNQDASIGSWSYFGNITEHGGNTLVPGMAVFNYGNLAPNGFIQQAFATEIGQEYFFKFNYRKNGDPRSQQLDLWLEGASKDNLLLDTYIDINSDIFKTFYHTFIADNEVTKLRFSDNASNNSYRFDMWIDNVSVTTGTTTVPTAVPEPNLVFGLLVSTGSLFARRRRNQSKHDN